MTDKEIFDNLKKEKLARRKKLKMLQFLKVNTNAKLRFSTDLTEEQHVELINQLRGIEISEHELRSNKYGSTAYKFIPDNNIRLR